MRLIYKLWLKQRKWERTRMCMFSLYMQLFFFIFLPDDEPAYLQVHETRHPAANTHALQLSDAVFTDFVQQSLNVAH